MPVLLLHKARSTCFEQAMVKRSMFENWGQPTTSNAEMKIQRSCLLSMQVPVPKILPKRLGLLQCIVFTPALMLCSAGIGAFPNGLSNMSMVFLVACSIDIWLSLNTANFSSLQKADAHRYSHASTSQNHNDDCAEPSYLGMLGIYAGVITNTCSMQVSVSQVACTALSLIGVPCSGLTPGYANPLPGL